MYKLDTLSVYRGITGSLLGTGSWAVSASRAVTSSFTTTASFARSASAATSITFLPDSASYARSASSVDNFSGYINFPDGLIVTGAITASKMQLTTLVDTTAANKYVVYNTSTKELFTTASTGGSGTGAGFPFSGSAVITGSMLISSSGLTLVGTGMTGSLFSGSLMNITEISLTTSGTIAANGTTTITLDLNRSNFFTVSASAAGTVTWQIANPPLTGRAQSLVIEYTNGGIKTNNWFTNTRWPGGIAPTLTSASVNPDMLSFTTDDAGTNWRGVLLQRGSA